MKENRYLDEWIVLEYGYNDRSTSFDESLRIYAITEEESLSGEVAGDSISVLEMFAYAMENEEFRKKYQTMIEDRDNREVKQKESEEELEEEA